MAGFYNRSQLCNKINGAGAVQLAVFIFTGISTKRLKKYLNEFLKANGKVILSFESSNLSVPSTYLDRLTRIHFKLTFMNSESLEQSVNLNSDFIKVAKLRQGIS